MTIRWETTQVDGSNMRIYLGAPDRPGPHPGIIVLQHRGGVDESIQDMVNRLYREGYVAAVPDFYHRQGPDVDPAKRSGLLRDDEMLADIQATITRLKSLDIAISLFGVVGFCLGGRASLLAASVINEFKAAAVFYGGNVMIARGDSPPPFARLSGIQCPVIGFFGADDTNPSPDDVSKISAELTRLGKWHEFHSYRDTGHAFHNFLEKTRYRERAARGSWHEMLAFFSQHLKRAGKR
jgi:carboxymethylenebutenolidase